LTARSGTCQSRLTGDSEAHHRADKEAVLNTEDLLAALAAVGHAQRLRIIAELYTAEQNGVRIHVSELARRLGLSRPLLYMHLDRLESAGLVRGNLELSEAGTAMKYFELVPFTVTLDAETIAAAVREDSSGAAGPDQSEATDGVAMTKGKKA
jgi:DNA-binding transcriptional ArsR family regulator